MTPSTWWNCTTGACRVGLMREAGDIKHHLVRLSFCRNRRVWTRGEVKAVVAAVADASNLDLANFSGWMSLNDFVGHYMLHADGAAEVVLHRRCCGLTPAMPRFLDALHFKRGETVFDDEGGGYEATETDMEGEGAQDAGRLGPEPA